MTPPDDHPDPGSGLWFDDEPGERTQTELLAARVGRLPGSIPGAVTPGQFGRGILRRGVSMATQTPAKANNSTTTIAKYDGRGPCNVQQLHGYFQSALPQIQKALPAAMKNTADRLMRCAITEFQKNPELARCSGLSILSCVVQAAQLGLEVGGSTGQCYMIPYKNEASFMLGYRGMISLAFRSGKVANIYATVIYEKDEITVQRGTKPGIFHTPVLRDAGPAIGAYAVVVYTSGQCDFEMMSFDEIEAHRKSYSKQPNGLLWTKAWGEAAKKTVLRRLLKRVPLAVELPGDFDDAEEVPTAVTGEVIEVPVQQLPEHEPTDNGVDEPSGALFGDGVDTSAQAK